MKTGHKRIQFRRLDWDIQFNVDMQNGLGFQITEPVEVSFDGTKERTLYGAQSPLYGTTYGDEHEFVERYRCRCGKLRSRQYEGEICPFCNTPVESRGSDIRICGWITLGHPDAYIINPLYFKILSNAIGHVFADEIVMPRMKVDKNGNSSVVQPGDLDFVPTHPFYGIGVQQFHDRYEEVLTYFMNLSSKKNKRRTFETLLKQKHAVFCRHIPIYSTLLRPQSFTQDTFYYQGADKIINPMFRLAESLEYCTDIEYNQILMRLQGKVNELWDYDFDSINGKEGLIQDTIMGGSLNYTARNVIVPDPTLKDNELDLSYHTFREVFKPKIIHYLQIYEDCTLSEAIDRWEKSFIFDESVYHIMEMIIKNEDIGVLINRNPTLNYYSMLLMKIRRVKRGGADYCLSVPLSILAGLNADFDGDILNIIGILDPTILHMFRKFDPIKRMIIARDTGLLNPYFTIAKSQKVDLYNFATCGAQENDTPETFPEKGKELTMQEWEKPIYVARNIDLSYQMNPEDLIDLPEAPEEALKDPNTSEKKPSKKKALKKES